MVFHEYEAAIAWGYTLREWQEETVVNRARAVAHIWHRNVRDAYNNDEIMAKAKNKPGAGSGQTYADLMRSMGLQK
jgi:hypothetical protein